MEGGIMSAPRMVGRRNVFALPSFHHDDGFDLRCFFFLQDRDPSDLEISSIEPKVDPPIKMLQHFCFTSVHRDRGRLDSPQAALPLDDVAIVDRPRPLQT